MGDVDGDGRFETQAKPRLRGRAELIRYADDFVILCKHERDAHRLLAVLAKRFERFGLRLHPAKTRVVRFERPRKRPVDEPRPETFDLLGFTHFWGKSKRGAWVVRRRTMKARLNRAAKAIRTWCRDHRHVALSVQRDVLSAKLRGHYGYYGITGNFEAIARLHQVALWAWFKWLGRRNNRGLTWPARRGAGCGSPACPDLWEPPEALPRGATRRLVFCGFERGLTSRGHVPGLGV